MKIKQLKEKTIKGFVDFLPKIGINNIEGLSNILNDKLSKSEGGEVNKPIVITNKDSNYSTTINPDGSIYIWDKNLKKNILNVQIDKRENVIDINSLDGAKINIGAIRNLIGETRNGSANIYDADRDIFVASKFKLRGGTNEQVLLGDGSTTDRLIKNVTAAAIQSEYNFNFITTGNVNNFVTIKAATSTTAGVMTADDKAKLDNIENTYISSQNGNIYSEYDTDNGNTTLDVTGNYDEEGSAGRIRLKYTEDNKGKLSIMLDGSESSVNAEKFSSIISPNKNEVWSTDGGRINVLNLLSNAAIYVAGGQEATQQQSINYTTVIDNPDNIIFDLRMKMFLARKGLVYYSHWNADISKNIAPPSRYGIENDNGVFPFNNQMYKFSNYDDIYIATCSNGTCSMKKLTLK